MTTIAISIEEDMLRQLRALAAVEGPEGKSAGRKGRRSVSALVREALRTYLEARRRAQREESDRRAIAGRRKLLARQAAVLVEAQAEP